VVYAGIAAQDIVVKFKENELLEQYCRLLEIRWAEGKQIETLHKGAEA
jgi:hypothetical protein